MFPFFFAVPTRYDMDGLFEPCFIDFPSGDDVNASGKALKTLYLPILEVGVRINMPTDV